MRPCGRAQEDRADRRDARGRRRAAGGRGRGPRPVRGRRRGARARRQGRRRGAEGAARFAPPSAQGRADAGRGLHGRRPPAPDGRVRRRLGGTGTAGAPRPGQGHVAAEGPRVRAHPQQPGRPSRPPSSCAPAGRSASCATRRRSGSRGPARRRPRRPTRPSSRHGWTARSPARRGTGRWTASARTGRSGPARRSRRSRSPTARSRARSGPPGAPGTPDDGTLAAQLVARSWDDLTSAQRRAIERKLGTPRSGAGEGGRPCEPGRHARPRAPGRRGRVRRVLHRAHGRPGAGHRRVHDRRARSSATTAPWRPGRPCRWTTHGGWSGPPVSCRIRISPTGQQASANALADTVAHEVFHCFQFTLADWTVLSPWILEGMAAWAASVAAGTEPENVMYAYAPYLEAPDQHLFTRAYDGVGFWGWAEQAGGADQLWSRLPAILTDATSANAFAAAGGADPGFLDGWASATFRYPKTGGAWNQVRPYPVPYTEQAPPATVVDADADARVHRLLAAPVPRRRGSVEAARPGAAGRRPPPGGHRAGGLRPRRAGLVLLRRLLVSEGAGQHRSDPPAGRPVPCSRWARPAAPAPGRAAWPTTRSTRTAPSPAPA